MKRFNSPLLWCLVFILLGAMPFYTSAQSTEAVKEEKEASVSNSHYTMVSSNSARGLVTIWSDLKLGKRGRFLSEVNSFAISEKKDCIEVHVLFKSQGSNSVDFGGMTYKLNKAGDHIIDHQVGR